MKKNIYLFAFLCLYTICANASLRRGDYFVINDFVYLVTSNTTVSLVGDWQNRQYLSIPETVRGITYNKNTNRYDGEEVGPYTVTGIGETINKDEWTFLNHATHLKMPNTIVKIAENVEFEDLVEVTFSKALKEIPETAFSNLPKLKTVKFPSDSELESISDWAFNDDTALEELTLPTSLISIGKNAFRDCTSLRSVYYGSGSKLTNIDEGAFRGCSSLNKMNTNSAAALLYSTLPDGIININARSFEGCAFSKFVMPENLETIGNGAFAECRNLVSIALPEKVSRIYADCFSCCSSLKTVSFPESLTFIDDRAFAGCTEIKSVYQHRREPFPISYNVFESIVYMNARLFVHETSKYEKVYAWKEFRHIIDIDGEYDYFIYNYDIIAQGHGTVIVPRDSAFELGAMHRLLPLFEGETVRDEEKIVKVQHWVLQTGVTLQFSPDKGYKVGEVLYAPSWTDGYTNVTDKLFRTKITDPQYPLQEKWGYGFFVRDKITSPKIIVTFIPEGSDGPLETQLSATFSVEDAIDGGVISNGIMKTSVTYTNNGSDELKFYPVIYLRKQVDGEWTERSNIYDGGAWTLKGGESYQTGTIGNVSDGHYKLEYGFQNAFLTKEFILGSKEVEVKYGKTEQKGDLTGDDEVNGMDLVALVNEIMGQQSQNPDADINGDGELNGMDYVALVNIIMAAPTNDDLAATRSSEVVPNNARGAELMSAHATGTSTLSIEPFDIKAGETKTMLIDLNNPDQQVTMVELYMQLPAGLTFTEGEDNPDIAGRTTWRRHSLYMTPEGNTYHMMIASSTNQLLSGTDGAIISIQLTAGSDFKGGTITLKKQLIGSPDMTESRPTDYSYAIKGDDTPPVGDDIIAFADPIVEALCLYYWDTDKDGKLSKQEAAAVTSLGDVFCLDPHKKRSWQGEEFPIDGLLHGNFTSFDELQYFTGLTSIDDGAFYSQQSLQSITLPASVKTIGKYAFYYCWNLSAINIPNSVETICEGAFYSCKNAASLSLGHSLKTIGETAFCNCVNLTEVTVPEGCTTICGSAFFDCAKLTKVTLPASLKSIGNYLFGYAEQTINIHLGSKDLWQQLQFKDSQDEDGIVEQSVFRLYYNGQELKEVEIPQTMTEVDNRYKNCQSITSLTLPATVTSISVCAFNGCRNLSSVTSYIETPFYIEDAVFEYHDSNTNKDVFTSATLNVPKGASSKYQSQYGWKNFRKIVEMGSGVSDVIPGDINGNGEVDDEDVDAFIELYLDDETPEEGDADFSRFDANGDGIISLADAVAIFYLSNGLNFDGTDPNAARKVSHGWPR